MLHASQAKWPRLNALHLAMFAKKLSKHNYRVPLEPVVYCS